MNDKQKATERKCPVTSDDIFTGLTFNGKPVSKDIYIQHYEEYVKRSSESEA